MYFRAGRQPETTTASQRPRCSANETVTPVTIKQFNREVTAEAGAANPDGIKTYRHSELDSLRRLPTFVDAVFDMPNCGSELRASSPFACTTARLHSIRFPCFAQPDLSHRGAVSCQRQTKEDLQLGVSRQPGPTSSITTCLDPPRILRFRK